MTKSAGKDEFQSSTGRKTNSTRTQQPVIKCPRCDSPNTKFCYYNNYSLSQPRHFCKTCRRYWTKGGAMRSVPIGGGCRKNKKMKSSSGDSMDSNGSSSGIGGLKFFQGITPAMDFQLGGISAPFPRIPNTALFNQFSSGFGNLSNTSSAISSSPCYTLGPYATNSSSLMGFNFPLISSTIKPGNNIPGFQEIGPLNLQSNIASSIESLSSINQDLHWKLQKQRLSMLLAGDNQQKGMNINSSTVEKPQPILFQNLEIAKGDESFKATGKEGGIGGASTEWLFDNSSYANMSQTDHQATSSNNAVNENSNSWSTGGIQAWNDLSHYSSLP